MNQRVLTGSCLCKRVRYSVIAELQRFYFCHCEQCRKVTGSAFASTNIQAAPAEVKWLSGAEHVERFDYFAFSYDPSPFTGEEEQLSGSERASGADDLTDGQGEKSQEWSLQLSSSPEKSVALQLVNGLKAKGYSAYLIPAIVYGGTWYRVRLGPFATERQARAMKQRITAGGQFVDALIFREPTKTMQVRQMSKEDWQVSPKPLCAGAKPNRRVTGIYVVATPEFLTPHEDGKPVRYDSLETLQGIYDLVNRQDQELAAAELRRLALDHPDTIVRAAAIEALRKFPPPSTVRLKQSHNP